MFREDKSTQMAAQFIKLAGGKLRYIILLKMMYVADKAMTLEWESPITFDNWVSMDYGPVLSNTYNLIRSKQPSYWTDHIETNGYFVTLQSDPGDGALSIAEEDIIQATFNEWGHKDWREAVKDTHDFPEWENPHGSSLPISIEHVLHTYGQSEKVATVLDIVETQNALQQLGGVA